MQKRLEIGRISPRAFRESPGLTAECNKTQYLYGSLGPYICPTTIWGKRGGKRKLVRH